MSDKIALLVCAHKYDVSTRDGGIYRPIQVGKALNPDLNLGYINDNEGYNVSEKNPYWCEYTALYWGWKNLKDVEYCGLCHYRRYFDLELSEKNVDDYFKKHDMIAIRQDYGMLSKRERLSDLAALTSIEDAYLFLDTLITMYPQFKNTIIDYFYNSTFSVPYSMFIARKEVYDQFCNFIFPVFFALETKLKQHGYSRQKRAMGYFGEFSLGLFIKCYDLKVLFAGLDSCGDAMLNITRKTKIKRMIQRVMYFFIDLVEPKIKEVKVPIAIKVGLKQDGINLDSLK